MCAELADKAATFSQIPEGIIVVVSTFLPRTNFAHRRRFMTKVTGLSLRHIVRKVCHWHPKEISHTIGSLTRSESVKPLRPSNQGQTLRTKPLLPLPDRNSPGPLALWDGRDRDQGCWLDSMDRINSVVFDPEPHWQSLLRMVVQPSFIRSTETSTQDLCDEASWKQFRRIKYSQWSKLRGRRGWRVGARGYKCTLGHSECLLPSCGRQSERTRQVQPNPRKCRKFPGGSLGSSLHRDSGKK